MFKKIKKKRDTLTERILDLFPEATDKEIGQHLLATVKILARHATTGAIALANDGKQRSVRPVEARLYPPSPLETAVNHIAESLHTNFEDLKGVSKESIKTHIYSYMIVRGLSDIAEDMVEEEEEKKRGESYLK